MITSEIALCQHFVKNKKNEIVGVITEKGDTLHAIPIAESRTLHLLAVKYVYLDKKIQIQDSIINNLEYELWAMELGYEDLMTNSGDTAAQLRKELQIAKDERNDLKAEARRLKRKLFWANVRTGFVAVIGGVIIWLVGK